MTEAEFRSWLSGRRHYCEHQASERHEFSGASLSRQFVPFFRTGQRIKVEMADGETRSGLVGVTTGWQPSFILLYNKRSTGSPWLLSDEDRIVATTRHGKYVPLEVTA